MSEIYGDKYKVLHCGKLNLTVNKANQKANIYTMYISEYVVKMLIRLIIRI